MKLAIIRGATLNSSAIILKRMHFLQDTNTSPTTDVCPHVAEYSAKKGLPLAFDCALRGPFDGLFLTRLSATRALCEVITDFISASTV